MKIKTIKLSLPIIQKIKTKILRMIINTPSYVSNNQTFHEDLKVKDVIKQKSRRHHINYKTLVEHQNKNGRQKKLFSKSEKNLKRTNF